MKDLASSKELDYGWARVTALSGITGVLAYVALLAADRPGSSAVVLAFVFAFGITVSSLGLYHVLGGSSGSRMALLGVVANIVAAAQLLAMTMVQLSVKAVAAEPEVVIRAIWGGLDVAWDLYVGTGTILFALCMFRCRGLGAWLGTPGLLIGGLLLILNIVTFPKPPVDAGLVDVGPLLGLWYLAVYIRLGTSSLLQGKQRKSANPLQGIADPN